MANKLKILQFEFIILVGLPLVTFAISPWLSFDPINPIKMFLLCSTSFLALLRVKNIWIFANTRLARNFLMLISFFFITLTAPLVLAPAPLTQQFWGYFGRNSGYLTYISLLVLLILSSASNLKSFYVNFIKIFIFCSLLTSIYCSIQLLNLDPIEWKSNLTFGTFGNVNFSSAFLGISSIIIFTSFFSNEFTKKFKILFLILIINNFYLIIQSQSIQGLAIFFFGVFVSILLIMRENFKNLVLNFSYSFVGFILSILAILAIFNSGPVAKFIFNDNIKYRHDYWEAGLQLTLKFPLTGIGLDSYGDWYRLVRDTNSAQGANFDRTSTSAHNLFLDLSSGGGIPLLVSYLLLVLYTLHVVIRYLRSNTQFNLQFVSILSAWCGYQVFTLISINNIGVAIWGWVINGLLIGICRGERVRSTDKTPMDHSIAFKGLFIGIILILFLGLTPFRADADFRNSFESGNLSKVISTSSKLGTSTYHRETALIILNQNGLTEEASSMAKKLIDFNPRSYTGWQFLYSDIQNADLSQEVILKNLLNIEPRFKS